MGTNPADYRLFEQARFQPSELFRVVRKAVESQFPERAPFVALRDDTLFRKRRRKVAGAVWRRDPLGLPFQCNLVWGQRFLQIAAALPSGEGPSPARDSQPIDPRSHEKETAKPAQFSLIYNDLHTLNPCFLLGNFRQKNKYKNNN